MRWKTRTLFSRGIFLASALSFTSLVLSGCSEEEAPSGCRSQLVYDPLSSRMPDAWPDDYWTRDDGGTKTGLRLHLVEGDNLQLSEGTVRFRKVFEDLSRLDGFGTTSGLYLRFSGDLAPDTVAASVALLDLSESVPAKVAISVSLLAEDEYEKGVVLQVLPLVPLKERRLYGLVVANTLRAAPGLPQDQVGGGCVGTSPVMRQLIGGTAAEPALTRLRKRTERVLLGAQRVGFVQNAGALLAAVPFTTGDASAESMAIAKDIRGRKIAYKAGSCKDSPDGRYRICDGAMAAADYRGSSGAIEAGQTTPQKPYEIPVVTYLPKGRTAPFPTILYGHGLNGDRTQGARLAEIAAPRGYATVAIDAVKHGNHPDKTRTIPAIDFFGISTQAGTDLIDSRKLRDAFRQSTYDKLQLVEMLRPGLDVDGDGKKDIDLSRFVYLGVSLGGIMGAEFVALTEEVKVAMPIVPGARVTDIVRDGEIFAPALLVLRGPARAGEMSRFFTLLQTAIDRGDPGVYAPYMVRSRLPGFDGRRPQVLMQMVIGDDTVPNSTNHFYARALGVPHVGDELLPIGTLQKQSLPAHKNLGEEHTAGVFQYDLVFDGVGPKTKKATHGNVAANPLTIEQTLRFIESGLAGPAEILDPYRTLGVKK